MTPADSLHGEQVLEFIRAGWRRCPDGSWRFPSGWPALPQPYPPFSRTAPDQAKNENRSQGGIDRSQDHPPFSAPRRAPDA
jgi:hypothetical protein